MYQKRLKILIAIFLIFLCIGVLRLFELQVLRRDEAIANIERIGVKATEILPTLRGSITDRQGRVLAIDTPRFHIAIGYDLARLRDSRFWEANALIRADTQTSLTVDEARRYWEGFFAEKIQKLDAIISAAYRFSDTQPGAIEQELEQINNRLWRLRRHFAWRRNFPHSNDISEYDSLSDTRRLALEGYVNDLAEMQNDWYVISQVDEDKLYEAQQFFNDIEGVRIIPQAVRRYPYDSSAAHTIGWVNPQQRDNEIFADDELLRYDEQELAGFKGVEYICEPLLRGKRGKIEYDSRTSPGAQQPREFGQDVRLTLDIELQKMLEGVFLDPLINANHKANMAAVVLDVASGDILAMISLPTFNLNTARGKFNELISDKRRPLENKALQAIYPPGSVIKPLILAAGLEEGAVTAQTIISCPLPAEEGWPRCWLQRRYGCHDDQFAAEGGNHGINAIRGSCNIYFTKLAHRIDARKLQQWLYDFGCGKTILQQPDFTLAIGELDLEALEDRNIREQQGIISNRHPQGQVRGFEDIPTLSDGEKRWFGMGQGNIRVTVLQMANAFATIARSGEIISPRLYLNCGKDEEPRNIGLSPQTLKALQQGLWEVVNKYHGTAYEIFRNSGFAEKGIEIYGKTGSSERPDNAWFAGYAKDKHGNSIAIALIIEQGQSGTRDAAPLAKEIFNVCNMTGLLKNK